MSIFAYSGCQSFFRLLWGDGLAAGDEKSSGIQDNFHFERVDILQGPVEVCPEIYEQLALYVWLVKSSETDKSSIISKQDKHILKF